MLANINNDSCSVQFSLNAFAFRKIIMRIIAEHSLWWLSFMYVCSYCNALVCFVQLLIDRFRPGCLPKLIPSLLPFRSTSYPIIIYLIVIESSRTPPVPDRVLLLSLSL